MPRAKLLSILLLLVITVAGLLVVEYVVRRLHPEATRALQLSRVQAHRRPAQHPDAEFHHSGDGIFRLSFPESTGGAPRIMIVGDSFAVGTGVEESARFGALIDRDREEDVDVLAVPSYSPVIYRNIVRRAMSMVEYSVVAVFVDQTDPVDDLIYQLELVEGSASGAFDLDLMTDREEQFREALDRVEAQFRGWRGVFRRSIVNLVRPVGILESIPADNPHYEYIRLSLARWNLVQTFQREPESRVTEAMERLLFLHLDQMAELCRSRGVEIVLAANPWQYQVTAGPGDNRLERLLLERYSGADGVTVLPLTAAFAAHPTPEELFLPEGDIHWNENGHALVAKRLESVLASLVNPIRGGS